MEIWESAIIIYGVLFGALSLSVLLPRLLSTGLSIKQASLWVCVKTAKRDAFGGRAGGIDVEN